MCGIAGIVGNLEDANRAALRRMAAAMLHRGPDGEGFWETSPSESGRGAMLAHRRLSILDISDSASQPMVDSLRGDAITFNGEIYNYRELGARLQASGHHWSSTGDTAVLLRHLAVRGTEGLCELRGMFALALWNQQTRQLMLARDPLGIKPLYLTVNPDPKGAWSVAFASEVRALLASGLLGTPRLNPRGAASIVWNGFTVAPETMISGVESLLPGELVLFNTDGQLTRRERFWSLPRPHSDQATDEAAVAQALRDSVRLHLISDVPLAVFLSGGVDSSAVANLAQEQSESPVRSFTLTFGEDEYNEGHHARRIAQEIGTDHQELLLTGEAFTERLDAALDSLDQPTFDGLNSYYMSHAVREAGYKVALVGSGGDELFGGYASFRKLPALMNAARWSRWLPQEMLVSGARWCVDRLMPSDVAMPRQTRWAKLPRMIRHSNDAVALYQTAYALFLPSFQDQLLVRADQPGLISGLPATTWDDLQQQVHGRTPVASVALLEQRLFLGERLLRDTDSVSMSASVEIRLPLVDQVLFDQVSGLPDRLRFDRNRSKSLLRRIGLRGLDPALFARPKSGFELPYRRWLRGSLGKSIDATLRDPQACRSAGLRPETVQRLWQGFLDGRPGLYWSRVWALYVLIRWCQRNHAHI